jgi:MFS family permease
MAGRTTLLFVWALGSSIGPPIGTFAIQLIAPRAFFVYVVVLTLLFTLFATWRLSRRKTERVVESREDFLAYPQPSPEIYAWLPYHKDKDKDTEREPQRTQDAAGDPKDAKP